MTQAEREFVKKCYGDDYINELLKVPYNFEHNEHGMENAVSATMDLAYIIQLIGKPHCKVLEMGCGSGWISIFLAKIGHDVTAVDISQDFINVVNARAEMENVTIKTHVSSFEELCLDEMFDVVIFHDCLHHSLYKLDSLKIAYMHLKSGGFVILFEPNEKHGNKYEKEIDEYGRLEQGLSFSKWKTLLEHSGFKNIKRYYSIERLFEIPPLFHISMLNLDLLYQDCAWINKSRRLIIRAEK